MNHKKRVAIVGTGRMGEYHTRIYAELGNIELIGVVDIDKEKVNRVAKQYNTKAFCDYREILDDKVDAVSIATPTYTHYQITKDFLNNKVDVLVEKPITNNYSEAEELLKLAKENNCVLHIGHVERFNAAVCELKNIVKNPFYIECRRLNPYEKRNYYSGVLLDLLIHDLDIVLSLVEDKEIKKIDVIARKIFSNTEDIAVVLILFKNGCIANLVASRVSEHKIRTLSINQSDAYIFLDYANQDLHIHRQATSKYFLSKETLQYKQEAFIERIFVHKDNPLKLEIQHFLESINNSRKSATYEDIESLRIILDIEKSLKFF